LPKAALRGYAKRYASLVCSVALIDRRLQGTMLRFETNLKRMMMTSSFMVFPISVAVLLNLTSCQRSSEHWYLTGTDSVVVVKEVSRAIEAWTDYYAQKKPEKVCNFWDSTPRLLYIENGERYVNWDSIHSAIHGIYAREVEYVEVIFTEKQILPLSGSSADVSMRFDFRVKFKPNRVWRTRGYLTALLVKEKDSWKILHGHESWRAVINK
jgi:ketosteroid isomerase-like protein